MVTRPRDCSWVPNDFPNIGGVDDFGCASDPDDDYNCIAWALGKTDRFWWPRNLGGYYWPPGLPREPLGHETVENFIAAFKTEGYEPCWNRWRRRRYQKIALYVNEQGRPKHAARLLNAGTWASKLGISEDIEHGTLRCLEGHHYGRATMFFKKRRPEYRDDILPMKFRSFLSTILRKVRGKFSPIPKENPTAS